MPSRVPISSAVRDGAEEAGQSVPPARPDQRSPRRVCRGASHLAQLPSETPFPLAPRLQMGNSIDVSLGLSAEKSPRAPRTLNHRVCVTLAHTTVALAG